MNEPKTWDEDDVLDLVVQWSQRPLLWDVQHKQYRDHAERLCAHKELATMFQATPGEIVIKLHDLRSQYSKYQKDYSTGGKVKRRSYKTKQYIEIMHSMFRNKVFPPTPAANCADLSEDHATETSNLSSAHFGDSEALDEDLISLDEFLANDVAEATETELLPIHNHSEHNQPPDQEKDCLESIDTIKSEQTSHSEESCDSSSETYGEKFEMFGDYVAEKLRNFKSPTLQRELKLVIQKELIKYAEIEHCDP